MILVNERFISADHIEHIYIEPLQTEGQHAVIVQLSGSVAIFGRHDAMTLQMALSCVEELSKLSSSTRPPIRLKSSM